MIFHRDYWCQIANTLKMFWMKPIHAEPLALHRIVLGSLGLLYICLYIGPNLEHFWGKEGIFPWPVVDDYLERTGRWCLLRPSGFPWLARCLPPEWVDHWKTQGSNLAGLRAAYYVWMLSLVGVIVGFFTRWTTLIAWFLTASFLYMAPQGLNGGDDILIEGLFYLLLAPAGAVWSVDAFIRKNTNPNDIIKITPWPVRLIQIQVVFMYLFTGISKIGSDWCNGEALYWVLQDFSVTRWPYAWLPIPMAACRLFSWATLIFEVGFPLWILIRAARPWLFISGVTLHIGIFVSMDVGWFSPFTLCWYVLFIPGNWLVHGRAAERSKEGRRERRTKVGKWYS